MCQRIPSLPWLVFTSFIDIGVDHIFELDQWNHADALDAEEIMHHIKLHMIKFNKTKGLKQNWQKTSISMHKARNKKKHINNKKGLELWNSQC